MMKRICHGCVGDFNEILFVHEKEGGNPRPQACMAFPLMSVKNADPYHSDHRLVVVVTELVQRSRGGSSGFKFEAS